MKMKKLSITFILTLIYFLNLQTTAQGLNDVCSPSILIVYAAGNSGQFFKSTNGGSTYSRVTIGSENINSVHSIGGTVWSAGNNGFYAYSSDFGGSWINIPVITEKLNSVFFIDTINGYICGDNGKILKSSNSGVNWFQLVSGVNFHLNKIKFTDQTTGYCCGESNLILKTTNGGINWFTTSVSPSVKIKTFDVLGNLIIAGGYSDVLYISSDNGNSWNERKLNIISHPAVNSVNILSSQNFNILLESGSIWNTTNSGLNFTFSTNEFRDEISSMYTLGNRAYAAAKFQNVIMRSTLSGMSWSLTSGTTYSISFVQLFASNNFAMNKVMDINYQRRGGMFVLVREKLYRTVNSGINWTLLSTLPLGTGNIYSTQLLINCKDSSKILAGVNFNISSPYCIIFRTSDYGLNWTEVHRTSIDAIGNYMNQDPQHPDTVYLGAKDSVFRSVDFGANWIKIATGEYDDWCDLAVSYDNSQVLYSSTNHYPAKLRKSTNGGYDWFLSDIIADTNYSEMPAIALSNLNKNLVLHAQLGPVNALTGLKRSFTSGNTWLFTQFEGASWAVDIAKDDPNLFVYGGVSYEPVFVSTNSGSGFVGSPNMYAEQLLYYDRANLFVNNHGTISKMKFTYNMPVIGIEPVSTEIPEKFSLKQNFPNPFNPVTVINFDISKNSFVSLKVYDITGKEISFLVSEEMKPGKYKVNWDASGFPSGVYFCRMTTDDFTESKKMILLK